MKIYSSAVGHDTVMGIRSQQNGIIWGEGQEEIEILSRKDDVGIQEIYLYTEPSLDAKGEISSAARRTARGLTPQIIRDWEESSAISTLTTAPMISPTTSMQNLCSANSA